MEDNEKIINDILRNCLTGYSIYDDSIIDCISKENRSLLRGLSRKDWLRLLCDVITMAHTDGKVLDQKEKEITAKVAATNNEDDKLEFSNLIGRDLYRQMKGITGDSIYEEREQKSQPDYEDIRNDILDIKGIGEAKADAIMEVIKENLGAKNV